MLWKFSNKKQFINIKLYHLNNCKIYICLNIEINVIGHKSVYLKYMRIQDKKYHGSNICRSSSQF